MKAQTKGFLALLLAAIIYSTFGVYARILNAQGLGIYQQIFLRGSTGLFFALLVVLITRQKFNFRGAPWWGWLIYMISFPLGVIAYVHSVTITKIATSTFGL